MRHLVLLRLVSGAAVALLGLVVFACSCMNVGYFADLGGTARRLGDDGSVGSLMSAAAGLLSVVLGALVATTSSLDDRRSAAADPSPDRTIAESPRG